MSEPVKTHDLSLDPTRGLSAADDLNVTLCDWALRHGLPLSHGDVRITVDRFNHGIVRLRGLTVDGGDIVPEEDDDE